jgi:hypothetical protein
MNSSNSEQAARMLPQNSLDPYIKEPQSFFKELGNLHDSRIKEIVWSPGQNEVTIALDDLYANFVGLPEYPGKQPSRLVMSNIARIKMDVVTDKFPPRVLDFEIEEVGSNLPLHVMLKFDPSGVIEIECGTVACRAMS